MKIEVHHYLHGDTEAERLIFEALQKILTELKQMQKKEKHEMADINEIKVKLDETLAEVTAQTTKIDSIDALMDGLRQQIIDLTAAAEAPQEVLDAINAVFAAAQANTAKIDAAIAENTPPA